MKLLWVALVGATLVHPRGEAADPPLGFARHDLTAGPYGQTTQGMGAGDVDGDGRPDLVVGGDEHLLLYANPTFAPSLVADGFKFGGGSAVTVYDVNRDGRMDVVTGRYPFDVSDLRESMWFENTPLGWREHRLSGAAYCHDVAFGDLDGDGRVDLACADLFRDELSWLAGPGDPRTEWTVHPIDARRVQGAAMADVDRDGRLDVVAGRGWYRNTGGSPPVWQRVALTTLQDDADRRFDDYVKVSVLDLDGDGRLDVFTTLFCDSREGQVWGFFQPPDPIAEPWPAVLIDPGPLFGVHSQGAGSFDGTPRPQLMVGETNIGGFGFGPNPSPEIYVYRRIGDARVATGWERIRVDTRGTHEAQVIDLNGDGLADIAGDEENTELGHHPRDGIVSWWENRTGVSGPPPPPCSDPAACPPPANPPPGVPPARPSWCDTAGRCPVEIDCGDPMRRALAAAACVCRDAGAGACGATAIVPKVARRWERACVALDRAATAPSHRVMARRARQAGRALSRVIKGAAAAASGMPWPCTQALSAGLEEARRRALASSDAHGH